MTNKDKLIGLMSPAVSIWGVSFAPGEPDDLLFLPVVALAIVEEKMGDPGSRIIRPLCFDREIGVDTVWWENRDEVLGYLLKEEIPRAAEIFAAEISREKNKRSIA